MCAGDTAAAQDVTQDVFVRLMERGPSKRTSEAVSSWLLTVADRMCIDRVRRERGVWGKIKSILIRESTPPLHQRSDDRPAEDSLRERLEVESLLERLQQALATLPRPEHEVMVRKYVEGRKQTDIATELNWSEGYVSKLLSRGVARLREQGWEVGDV